MSPCPSNPNVHRQRTCIRLFSSYLVTLLQSNDDSVRLTAIKPLHQARTLTILRIFQFLSFTDRDNFYTPTPSQFWNYTQTRVMTPKKGVQLSSFTKANFHFARRGQLEDLKYRTAIILSARAPPRTLLAELTALFQTIAGGEEARCPLFKNPTSDLGPSGL